MQVFFTWLWVGVAVSLLAPPTLSFSHGASPASCQEMIPGHIRAHSQDPRHSHITLGTSAKSYLPGQLVTVTVRSSRDFMGFLLQARRVEDPGVSVRTRGQAKAVVESKRTGPVLVGGSWALIPPGTHTLRCFSEDDALTHSDKQLKRNLSFVWRAPDAPMGDMKFYMTVVQSYFVYWAGIQSAVVHDGSRSRHRRSNTTVADGGNLLFELQEDEIAPPTGLGRNVTSTKKPGNKTDSPATSLATSKIHSYTSVEQLAKTNNSRPEMVSLSTSESPTAGTNQVLSVTSGTATSGSLPTATKSSKTGIYPTTESRSGIPEEEHSETNTPVSHTDDSKSSGLSSNQMNSSASRLSLSSGEMRKMKDSLSIPGNVSQQNPTGSPYLLNSRTPVFPLKDGKMERVEAMLKFKVLRDSILHKKGTTTTDSFHNPSQQPVTQHPSGPVKGQTSLKLHSRSSSLLFWMTNPSQSKVDGQSLTEAQNSKFTHDQTSSGKPVPQFKTFTPKYRVQPQTGRLLSETSPPRPFPGSKSSLPKSLLRLETTTSYPSFQSQTNPVLVRTEHPSPQTPSKKHQHQTLFQIMTDLSKLPYGPQAGPRKNTSPSPQVQTAASLSISPQTIPAQNHHQDLLPQTNRPWSGAPPATNPEQPRTQSHHQTDGFAWKKPQLSVTPQPFSPLTVTNQTSKSDVSKRIKDIQAPGFSPNVAFITSTTPAPPSAAPTLTVLPASPVSVGPVSSATGLYSSGGPAVPLASTHPPPSTVKILKKTKPVFTPLLSPTPISFPIPSVSVPPSSTTIGTNSSSSSAPFFSFSPSSTASLSISDSAFSSSAVSSLGSSTFTTHSSTASTSSSSFSTSTSTSSPFLTLSIPFQSPSSRPEPSPAPRSSLYNLVVPSSSPSPDQRTTLAQKLLIEERGADSQSHLQSSHPDQNFHPRTVKTAIQPKPHPSLNPSFKQNHDQELNSNNPKAKPPSHPSGAPDGEGKYPDIIPRHRNWELGMLLGCSAGLGMVLVVGVRYVCRQACGKQTAVTLNDREREYGRGERGPIHVQECGDLVKVRRIRENSFVVLAEYDVLASPGD